MLRAVHPVGNGYRKRVPWYFISQVSFFILPLIWLLTKLKTINYPALLKSLGLIMLLGYAWSYLVSSQGWWTFNSACMLCIQVLPHMPLEEIMFYPLGGALSILLYVAFVGSGANCQRAGWGYWLTAAGLTGAAIAVVVLAIWLGHGIPRYLISQLVLFNGLTLALWFRPRSRVLVRPAIQGVLLMSLIGFLWNWIAFTHSWWSYHATLGWFFPPRVPVDDWNFFIFAPLAAMTLYETFGPKGGGGK